MKYIIIYIVSFIVTPIYADIYIASLNSLGHPMTYGVCDTMAAIADNGIMAFIAPMEDRADSRTNGFHASFLLDNRNIITLYPGYLQKLSQLLHVYSKTTNVRLAANRDFTVFAIIVEKIKSGTSTGSDVTVPMSTGTWLVIVDAFGNTLQQIELCSTKGNISASQCHVSFTNDGQLLAACGQYLGLMLFDLPTTDLTSFASLDVGYKTGTSVITNDGTKVFFTRDSTTQRSVFYVDTITGIIVDTGLTASNTINDAQVAVNHDGSTVAFRKTANSLSICSLKDGTWNENIIDGTHIRSPAISADGRYVVYQTHKTLNSQIMEYDCRQGTITLISQNDNGNEANADCTSPSISADGSWIAFVSAASNLVTNSNGQPQLFVSKREAPSFLLKIKRGWNFCGTPLTLDERSVNLLKNEPACWGWSKGRFHLLESFQAGQGFWLYTFEDKTLQLTGEKVEPMPLQYGWNLVMLSLYQKVETTICFCLQHQSYVRLSEDVNRSSAGWIFHIPK